MDAVGSNEFSFVDAVRLGDELLSAGRFADAEPVFRALCAADPGQLRFAHCLAVSLIEQELPAKCTEAIALIRPLALYHRDELVTISCNMGKALGELGRTVEAEAAFEHVLRSYPSHLIARYGRGLMRMQCGRHAEAIADFNAVIEKEPDNGKARFARGFANLVLGNYMAGFSDYEHRLKDAIAPIERPEWTGSESLVDQTILIHGEQGLGDAIMFARYLPELAARAKRVLLWTPSSVRPLLAHLPVTLLEDDRATWPAFDCWAWNMSLARCCRTTAGNVPPPVPLRLGDLGPWTARIASGKRLRVGLVWSGARHSRYDRFRSIPLGALAPLFGVADVAFYSLQLDVRDEDRAAFEASRLVDLAPHLHSFLDTAQAMACLDLVITVDTSVAHLAGTVGVPTFVMLTAFRTYWLWIEQRETSPWYPSARIFRQTNDGDWGELVGRVRDALRVMATRPQALAS